MANVRPQNVLNEFKLRMTCAPLEGAIVKWDKPQTPTMAISIKDNQVVLTVYTNVEGDKDNGRIQAEMDTFTFYGIMEAIRTIADDKTFAGALTIDNMGHFFTGGGRSEKPGILSQTVIGRDSEGSVFISLISGKRPKAKFVFRPSGLHNWSRNGEPLSRAETSEIYARGQANVLSKLVARVLGDEFISYQDLKARRDANKAARQGGGGGGNYQKPQNQSQGAPSSGNDHDDDIPW